MYEVKDLQPIFAAYCRAGTIQARWFSGELRAGKGDVVRYVHDGVRPQHGNGTGTDRPER